MKLAMRVISQNYQPEGKTMVQASALERSGNLNLTLDADEADDFPVGRLLEVDLKLLPAQAPPKKDSRAELARP